jgi:hypothetical protein
MGNIHVNDVGVTLTVQILDQNSNPLDISMASQLGMTLFRPDRTVSNVTPVFSTTGKDGIVQYTTQPGDLPTQGTWGIQVYAIISGATYYSDINTFKVLSNTFGWQNEITILLRHLIADVGPAYTYGEISFPTYYQINVAALSIIPDPTIAPNRDDSFINLITLKAACIADGASARLAAQKSVIMRDADKMIDLHYVSPAMLDIWKKGWCKNYDDARYEYLAGNVGSAGTAIIGPFRDYAAAGGYGNGPWTPDGGSSYGGAAIYGSRYTGLPNDGRFR